MVGTVGVLGARETLVEEQLRSRLQRSEQSGLEQFGLVPSFADGFDWVLVPFTCFPVHERRF